MIRVRDGRIVWRESDLDVMADVIGGSAALNDDGIGAMPLVPSVLKLAKKKGAHLHASAREALQLAIVERREAKRLKNRPAPEGPLDFGAFVHQRQLIRYIRSTRYPAYLIADGTGVGKTLPAMLVSARVWAADRILVVCRNRAKRQWRREIRRWLGDNQHVTIVQGTIAEQNAKAMTRAGWVIAHWEALVHAADGLTKLPWNVVIADEAHWASNRDATRTQTLHALEAEHRLALTAHPYSNSTEELYSILKFLYPETYTSFWRFAHQHVRMRPGAFGDIDMLGPKRPKTLRWELAPFTIRRTKQQVFKNLPPITRQVIDCELTARGVREYERLKKEFFAELDALDGGTKVLPIINSLSRGMRLRQYLVDPGMIGGREKSPKYEAVLDWLNDLDGPPVLFTSFREAAKRLTDYLVNKGKRKRSRIGLIAGGMSTALTDAVQRRFLKGAYDIVLCVTAAASESLNLGKYGYVGLLDLPWNPRTLEQAEGRVDRPEEGTGKLVPTTSWRFIVPDSYEEKMETLLERKHGEFAEVFTVNELRRLFA